QEEGIMQTRRSFLAGAAALAAAPMLVAQVHAQTPVKQLTVIVGYPPGGGTDSVARVLADSLRGKYADVVVVENRAGAGGRIAAEYVSNQPADGSVMLYTPAFPMIIYPHIYSKLPYDTLTDFTPVAPSTIGMLAISIGPAVPEEIKTLEQFVAWCKANPDKASFGGPLGSSQHFSGVMFARGAGIDLRLIGYKGGAPAVVDALGGHIPMVVTPLSEALPHVREGRLRMLATTGRRRSKAVPDVPTLYELGYKDVIFQDWSGFLAPAG